MRKNLLLVFLIPAFLPFSSCMKNLEERLIGSWQLEDAWRQKLFGRDHFTTGYESGIFTFMENGDATYVSATDTLKGNWRAGRHTINYYNTATSQYETRGMKFLHISLVNFQQNVFLNWEFDDFRFGDTWQEIRAEQYSLSNDRVYEFERR